MRLQEADLTLTAATARDMTLTSTGADRPGTVPQGDDLTTFGELLAEDTFRVPRARVARQVFLFEKMLLITKKRDDGTLVYKTHILVSGWRRRRRDGRLGVCWLVSNDICCSLHARPVDYRTSCFRTLAKIFAQ